MVPWIRSAPTDQLQWQPTIRIDPIGVTLHEQIGMDVKALDPHFDPIESLQESESDHSIPARTCGNQKRTPRLSEVRMRIETT